MDWSATWVCPACSFICTVKADTCCSKFQMVNSRACLGFKLLKLCFDLWQNRHVLVRSSLRRCNLPCRPIHDILARGGKDCSLCMNLILQDRNGGIIDINGSCWRRGGSRNHPRTNTLSSQHLRFPTDLLQKRLQCRSLKVRRHRQQTESPRTTGVTLVGNFNVWKEELPCRRLFGLMHPNTVPSRRSHQP